MPREFAKLAKIRDPRLVACNVALGRRSGLAQMFGSNDQMEASMFPSKLDVDESIRTKVPMLQARGLIDDLSEYRIFLKLNCEGAEVPILEDLLDADVLHLVHRALIDWDIGKVPSEAYRETAIAQRMHDNGFKRWDYWPDAPTHAERVDRWIREHWA